MAAIRQLSKQLGNRGWDSFFAASRWAALARLLQEETPIRANAVELATVELEEGTARRVRTTRGEVLVDYYDLESAPLLEERLGVVERAPDRAGLLERLALSQETRLEATLRLRGTQTQRRAWEDSFWHRLAYHCVRSFEANETSYHLRFAGPGDLRLLYRAEQRPVLELHIGAERAHAFVDLLADSEQTRRDLSIHPTELEEVTVLRRLDDGACELRPAIRVRLGPEVVRLIDREAVQATQAGRVVLVEELGLFGRLAASPQPAIEKSHLEGDEVPEFLERHRTEIEAGVIELDDSLRNLRVFRAPDGVELRPRTRDRSWYWIAARYRYGTYSVDLATALRARHAGKSYLETEGGWIDLRAAGSAFDFLEKRLSEIDCGGSELRLHARDLLRLRGATEGPWTIEGEEQQRCALEQLLAVEPAAPFAQPRELITPLRGYQERGAEWLLFLYENGLGGLLCDDMGLGKTHQVMALMATLVERPGADLPILVVSPTTVISHWRNKLREHTPGLNVVIHHGSQRSALGDLGSGDVVLTSYGVLRQDAQELGRVRFEVAVFDEIQYLKNRRTLAYEAANAITAEIRLGLTGTPIENSIEDLHALFDLVLPGYLGSVASFRRRYTRVMEAQPEHAKNPPRQEGRLTELRRIIAPFVLRRLKKTVLDELPEKIVDVRTCALSDFQAEQYRTVVAQRAGSLVERLEQQDEALPYIHVFAVLNLLKQICDHPALALGDLDGAKQYESGKWELFVELLRECLDHGQKVVVFSQYLGMITLMSRHLASLEVDHAVLTGSTRKRGEVVDRFNQDPNCRVFLGSLKAGGTGIDLVAGSTVIHYDQWWNAAREDQATDRLHRIGQKRVVHVLKLVTEGTLEEKIATIVEDKRRLLENLVTEDDPSLAKTFTRDQLLELLHSV